MYTTKANLLIGFHGCDKNVGELILAGGKFNGSSNDYDWLGHGIYFWEGNPSRALSFAKEYQKRQPSKIETPFVVGAVLDLGYCLDLLDSQKLQLVKKSYVNFKKLTEIANIQLPKNISPAGTGEKLIRSLDCAVIQYLHTVISGQNEKPFDSVRGLFPEGKPLYQNAGFRIKDHIQICIRNPNCIKGYFRPRNLATNYFHV